MELPLAHVGHWAFYVLYAVPVLIVLGSIVLTTLRQRRERGAGGRRDI
jgi:heme exporter protein D